MPSERRPESSPRRESPRREEGKNEDELIERLVHINRVVKVVKGGRRFGFAALVVVGDGRGRAGFGHGKAKEVPEAVRKAGGAARRAMHKIPLRGGRTLHHDSLASFGAGKVIMRSAPPGTGIIAGGVLRALFEVLGVKDVVVKSLGSVNPYNMLKAAFKALALCNSPRMVAQRRGKKAFQFINGSEEKTAAPERNELDAQTGKKPDVVHATTKGENSS